MANEVHVYFFNEVLLKSRQIQTKSSTQIPLPEWLGQNPDSHQLWEVLLDRAWDDSSSGVQHITYFRRGVGSFPDLETLSVYYPELQERFKPVDYFEFDGDKWPLAAYTQGTDFPPDYTSWLTVIDRPGWQFFTYEEMAKMVRACEELLTKGSSPFEESWKELISAHKAQTYDLALFTHEI